jgi:hypothetical protein
LFFSRSQTTRCFAISTRFSTLGTVWPSFDDAHVGRDLAAVGDVDPFGLEGQRHSLNGLSESDLRMPLSPALQPWLVQELAGDSSRLWPIPSCASGLRRRG